MKQNAPRKRTRPGQNGYALLIIVSLLALLAVSVATVAPNVITNTRREREEEMIWRGKQYVRGIRLFYAKTHRFPTELEDLYKPKTGIRFMRQAFKDPMNAKDGSWRLIYVGPNGMLIGSTRPASMNFSLQSVQGFGNPIGGGIGSAPQGNSSMFGSSNGFGSASSFGSNNASAFNNGPGVAGTTGSPSSTDSSGQLVDANGKPIPADPYGDGDPALQTDNLNDSPVMGGNIIGVGSKLNQRSIIWYQKAKNYRQFEFVWDPSTDALTGNRPTFGPNSAAPGTALPGTALPGTSNPGNTAPVNTPINPDPNANPPLQAPPNQ